MLALPSPVLEGGKLVRGALKFSSSLVNHRKSAACLKKRSAVTGGQKTIQELFRTPVLAEVADGAGGSSVAGDIDAAVVEVIVRSPRAAFCDDDSVVSLDGGDTATSDTEGDEEGAASASGAGGSALSALQRYR